MTDAEWLEYYASRRARGRRYLDRKCSELSGAEKTKLEHVMYVPGKSTCHACEENRADEQDQ